MIKTVADVIVFKKLKVYSNFQCLFILLSISKMLVLDVELKYKEFQ